MNPNRREVITTLSGAAAFAVASSALAQAKAPAAAPAAPAAAAAPAVNRALIDAAMHCVEVGKTCEQHCVTSLSAGDKMMAECIATVRLMLPSCEAVAQFARQNSPHLKALAAVCAKVCRDCEATCKKHASHHEECKACMESCAKCAAECEKAAA